MTMNPYPAHSKGAAAGLRRQAVELRKKAADLQKQLDHSVGVFGEAFARLDAQVSTEDRIAKASGRNRRMGVSR
jgi:hypothetical protein